jgi:hypothetical protein
MVTSKKEQKLTARERLSDEEKELVPRYNSRKAREQESSP